MTKYALQTMVLVAMLLTGALPSRAQSPTASPISFTFTYQVNTTPFPAPAKLTATLPKTAAVGYTLTAAAASTPLGWLTVTPDSGASPLALTVTVNPTGLSPGSYSGTITIGTFPASGTTIIPVTLSISNPPSALIVSPPFPVPSYYTPQLSGSNASVRFDYTTGQSGTLPLMAELDVASNGGIIPFSVVAVAGSKAAAWLRINVSNQLPNSHTSGVALSGSYVPIDISIDFAALSTLDVGSYPGTITFTNNTTGGTAIVNVNLNVSAGAPKVDSIFPASVIASPATGRVPPVITIYGNNFFSNSSVRLMRDGNVPFPDLPATLLSRKVLQARLDPNFLTTPGTFTLTVANTKTLADPNPHEDSIAFTVVDSTIPMINSVVNSASYLKTATQTGSAPDPVPSAGTGTSVSPREIITIFGQNLGPADVTQAQASTGLFPNTYPSQVTVGTAPNTTTYQVIFTFGVDPTCMGPACPSPAPLVAAPLIMVSNNQINALVPVPPLALAAAGLNAWVQIVETISTVAGDNIVSTAWLPVTVVPADPGAFTFGGLGLGQAAVLNYDAVAGYSINSAKNPAPKGSTISLYATGLGDLMTGVRVDVTDSSATPQKISKSFGLVINANPAATASLIITPMSPPAGIQNSPYLATTLQATGGTPPYQWSVAPGLPPGMSLNSAGLLTGTPTIAGLYTMAVAVTDSSLPKLPAVSASYAITIFSPIVTITTVAVPGGVQSETYTSITLQAAGGSAPYQWSAISGLPPGLSLNPAGLLAGTPTSANAYTVSVQVQDNSTPPATATVTYPLTIAAAGQMAIISAPPPSGVVSVPYITTAFKVQGGTLPLTWFAAVLPAGLSLDLVKGVLSGTPLVAGTTSVTVTVIDSAAPMLIATYTYSLTVAPALAITTAALAPLLPVPQQYVAYAALTMQAQGGTPPYTWTASGLPPGLILNAGTGMLSGVPTTPVFLPLPDGAVALGAVYLNDNTYRVDIDGQPAVTSYAGASQGSVAGLVQINAIVPPTARTGAAISVTVSIGSAASARRSQLGVTIAVK
jgi:uncharacterized protein (TIGR03437 family)